MNPRARKAWTAATVLLLLSLHFALAVGSKLHESATVDEPAHLTSGLSLWKFNDYRLQPESGNLSQRWEALPAFLAGAAFPDLGGGAWRDSNGWSLSHAFLYGGGRDTLPLLLSARAMTALVSAATGLLVFLWSRSLFGTIGGLVSLVFFCLCPTFLAHGALATSDAYAAFFMVAALGAWWRHLSGGGWARLALSSALLGLALLSKFSSVLLLPMMALCALVPVLGPEPMRFGRWTFEGPASRLGLVAASGAAHLLVASALIWASYGFRFGIFNPSLPPADRLFVSWAQTYERAGAFAPAIHLLASLRALPEAFLYGFGNVVGTSAARGSFLNGEHSHTGWPSFFLWAFALKTTLPFLIASCVSVGLILRSRRLRPLTPLLVLVTVYALFSVASHLNIGQRHLMPIYPPLFIAAGALGAWSATAGRWGVAAVSLLLGWHGAEAMTIAPHFLAYFNEVGGGPSQGYRHLVDSSLDWGQDLPGLKDWLGRNGRPAEPAYLSYFGTADPRYYGIVSRNLGSLNSLAEEEPYVGLEPGLYAISATFLDLDYCEVQGPWTAALEKEYEALRTFEPDLASYARSPADRLRLEKVYPASTWRRLRERFQHLRFARLCLCLRARTPDAVIGYSIFVYRLSGRDLFAATGGSLADWTSLIERSISESSHR